MSSFGSSRKSEPKVLPPTFDVILTGPDNWDKWYEMVELKAMCCGFLQYINSDSKTPLPTPPPAFNDYYMAECKGWPLVRIYTHELAKKEYDEYSRKSEEMMQFICERVALTIKPGLPSISRCINKNKEGVSPRSLLRELKFQFGGMARH